jgi:hypothetical protein
MGYFFYYYEGITVLREMITVFAEMRRRGDGEMGYEH